MYRAFIVLVAALAAVACDSSTGLDEEPQELILFAEDFEGTFAASGWLAQPGLESSGVYVPDPLDPSNSVMAFSDTRARGDAFSPALAFEAGRTYVLSFDFLGLVDPEVGESDGYIGVSDERPGDHVWLGAGNSNTSAHGPEAVPLINDGQWRTYSVEFDPSALVGAEDGFFHVMLEDGDGGEPMDAFFDDLRVTLKN